MINSLAKNISDSRDPKYGAILAKHEKLWLKNSIKFHHEQGWNCCTQISSGETGWTSLIRDSPTIKAFTFIAKGLSVLMDIWDSTQQNFHTWERAQQKFRLTNTDQGDWDEVTNKISEQWCNLLEGDEDIAYPGQWLGFYLKDEEDPVCVFQCKMDFKPECLQCHNATLPFPMQCYTIGTHSRCLSVWERPLGELEGYFHIKVKVIHTDRGPKKEGEKEKIIFFYGKLATLGWDPDRWQWIDKDHFLNYTTKDGRNSIINRNPGTTRAAEKWQGYLPGNYRFY